MTRFPVFWEDDTHWFQTGGHWDLETYIDAFLTPGLKILNVHPFYLSANVPSQDYYSEIKSHVTTLSAEDIETVRYNGAGLRTFFLDLIKFLKSQNETFYTLHELHQMFPAESWQAPKDESAGRHTKHTGADYERYWQMTESARQDFVKESYKERDAKDVYATSRDLNARELEIRSMVQVIYNKGTILDIGCGNGYTLISLAKHFDGLTLTGIDFSDNLIEGAKYLVDAKKDELKSLPSFICADAIAYLDDLEDNSLDYVISERFIQNLPSAESQRSVIRRVHEILREGGRFLMCEGSEQGFRALNEIREKVGLQAIPDTSADNISAIRLVDDEIEGYAQSEIGFKVVDKLGFSQYFLISRVLHPLLIAPLRPRFDAKINEIARLIQENVEFRPGYGSNVLWVLEK